MAENRRDTKEGEAPDRTSWGDLQGSLKDRLGYRALGDRQRLAAAFFSLQGPNAI